LTTSAEGRILKGVGIGPGRLGFLAAAGLAAVALTFGAAPALACLEAEGDSLGSAAPEILDSSLAHSVAGPVLSISVRAPAGASPDRTRYVVEKVWGESPGWNHLWGVPLSPSPGSELVLLPAISPLDPGHPFGFSFQVRAIEDSGALGPPSAPVRVSHAGNAATTEAPRADQILFLLLVVGLFTLWAWYRSEHVVEDRIRLAGAVALASLLFLSVTPAMPWLATEDPAGTLPAVECALGHEVGCATYIPIEGPDPLRSGDPAAYLRAFELQRWESAAGAVRIGQVMTLALLLPALIWLIVAPRSRAAQAATVVGASAAALTFVSVLLYRATVPSWLSADLYWTADLALLATANVVIAALLVVKHSFALLGPAPLPPAIARERSAEMPR
jgi:hypothetical protein